MRLRVVVVMRAMACTCSAGVGRGLAVVLQRQRLEADLLAGRHPALGLDARHHGGGPQRLGAAQGLHFAIGVGVGGFQQQLLRLARLGHVVDGELAAPLRSSVRGSLSATTRASWLALASSSSLRVLCSPLRGGLKLNMS
jgi:hypothetical protein